ncbi:MAG: hypothetical protein CVU18_06895 [Betaproteobacteria bacterium HGW-Betaproteobacteria-12]|jgi:hypothetical protein|nr:MAG: hypothetical protein CVU18_06895 [Betaproteobacteria bacterium HGW-Betaproteobacteria-12]
MKAEDLLHKMLEIQSPWQIVRIREDLGKHQIDVWIGRQTGKSSWFFGHRAAAAPEDREHVWRHVNLGDQRCLIHAALVDDPAPPGWSGELGMPFSRALARLIAAMMREGIKLQSICGLLDLTVSDLWKFKHTLDNGKAGLSGAPLLATDEAGGPSAVPEPDHPVWERLLDGSLNIDIRLLSLKFLLSKLREQMRLISDSEVRVLKAYELQRYFVRYERALGHELAQLADA